MTPPAARRILRVLYMINGLAAAAAALALAIAPGAIPAAVGIAIEPSANLLAYLLAAAELAIATLCGFAVRSSERAVDLQTIAVLTVFHLASAAAGLTVAWAGESALILWNVLARILVVAALAWCARAALGR